MSRRRGANGEIGTGEIPSDLELPNLYLEADFLWKAIKTLELLCVWEFIPLGGIKLILFGDRKKVSLRPIEAKSYWIDGLFLLRPRPVTVGCNHFMKIFQILIYDIDFDTLINLCFDCFTKYHSWWKADISEFMTWWSSKRFHQWGYHN